MQHHSSPCGFLLLAWVLAPGPSSEREEALILNFLFRPFPLLAPCSQRNGDLSRAPSLTELAAAGAGASAASSISGRSAGRASSSNGGGGGGGGALPPLLPAGASKKGTASAVSSGADKRSSEGRHGGPANTGTRGSGASSDSAPDGGGGGGEARGEARGAPLAQRDVNMRGVYVHVLGDLLQSMGVALAGLIIWWCAWTKFFLWVPLVSLTSTACSWLARKGCDAQPWSRPPPCSRPQWRIVDPIVTFFFSALVRAWLPPAPQTQGARRGQPRMRRVLRLFLILHCSARRAAALLPPPLAT